MQTTEKEKSVPDYVHGTFTIASDDILGYRHEGDYDEYREWCEANGLTPGKEDSAGYWEWLADQCSNGWNNDLENLKNCKEYDVPVAVTGHAGLWNGDHEYMPAFFDNVKEAIDRIIHRCLFDNIEIKYEDGKLAVYGHHHDGTNVYNIGALSKKGIAKRKAAERRYEDVTELLGHDYKRLPYLYAI